MTRAPTRTTLLQSTKGSNRNSGVAHFFQSITLELDQHRELEHVHATVIGSR